MTSRRKSLCNVTRDEIHPMCFSHLCNSSLVELKPYPKLQNMSPPALFPAVTFLHSAPAPRIPSVPFCFADLPLDLFALVLDFLTSCDLARFARVAKFHNTVITPKLYKDVRIKLIPDCSKGGKPLYVKTVENCLLALVRKNAKYVESFAFHIDGGLLREYDITDHGYDLIAEGAFMVPRGFPNTVITRIAYSRIVC